MIGASTVRVLLFILGLGDGIGGRIFSGTDAVGIEHGALLSLLDLSSQALDLQAPRQCYLRISAKQQAGCTYLPVEVAVGLLVLLLAGLGGLELTVSGGKGFVEGLGLELGGAVAVLELVDALVQSSNLLGEPTTKRALD